MDVHVQPDRLVRKIHSLIEREEMRRALRPAPFEGKEIEVSKVDGITQVLAKGHHDRFIPMGAKMRRQEKIAEAYARAQSRQGHCWMPDCTAKAQQHVLCIDFDCKTGDHDGDTILSTLDEPYPGPVPGFCDLCMMRGAKALAEVVYNSKAQMKWGLRPDRWWVVFLNEAKIGGPCADISRLRTPIVTEVHEPG